MERCTGSRFRPVALTGTNLLNDRNLNKGTAFTEQERADFELGGLLPPQVQTFEAQLSGSMRAFLSACSDIEKYQNLRALRIATKPCSTPSCPATWRR